MKYPISKLSGDLCLGALKPLKQCKAKRVFFSEKNTHFSNHDIFDSKSSLDLGSVSMHAHGPCASHRSD